MPLKISDVRAGDIVTSNINESCEGHQILRKGGHYKLEYVFSGFSYDLFVIGGTKNDPCGRYLGMGDRGYNSSFDLFKSNPVTDETDKFALAKRSYDTPNGWEEVLNHGCKTRHEMVEYSRTHYPQNGSNFTMEFIHMVEIDGNGVAGIKGTPPKRPEPLPKLNLSEKSINLILEALKDI